MNNDDTILSEYLLKYGPWQAFERAIARLLIHNNFTNVRVIGGSGDGGGDIIASKFGKRHVFQIKFRSNSAISEDVVSEVRNAMRVYHAAIPVIVTNGTFSSSIIEKKRLLQNEFRIPLQLWGEDDIRRLQASAVDKLVQDFIPRGDYQISAINDLIQSFDGVSNSGLVVMATGLGKTITAFKGIERLFESKKISKVLVLAHTNDLVYQLERASWRVLEKQKLTAIWNGREKGDIDKANMIFACIDSVTNNLTTEYFGDIDYVIIDEAHHAGSKSYQKVIDHLEAGKSGGPYLLGLTATPWRSDDFNLREFFEDEICKIDLVEGLSKGYLANIDYRMHVDDIDWEELAHIKEATPKMLNKKIFITEWNDAVVQRLQEVFSEVVNPRAVVFCNTIEHAELMKSKISAKNFARAEVLHSGTYGGRAMNPQTRNLYLSDFSDGRIDIMCVVDIFNEGMDVPDINIIVFQRVTHSRTIFIQQLGRGLRLSEGKEKVVVLDFVSDIRRVAAAMEIQSGLESSDKYIRLGKPVKFINKNDESPEIESFFNEWLKDVAAIEEAGENEHVLKYPPDPKLFIKK